MQKINMIQRFIKSVSDFEFSNHFLREKVGKAIGFMLLGYVIFALVMGVVTLAVIGPEIKQTEEYVKTVIQKLPEFRIDDGEFILEGNETYMIVTEGDLNVILDLEEKYSTSHYGDQYDDFYVITSKSLYSNETELLTFDMIGTSLSKSTVVGMPRLISMFFYLGLAFLAIIGIVGVFIVSGLVWAIVIIINGFVKKDISSANCYKVAIYSMVVPGGLLLLNWTLNINIPAFYLVYTIVAGVYAYQFLTKYKQEAFDIESIYE